MSLYKEVRQSTPLPFHVDDLIPHTPSSFRVRNLYPWPHHELHIYCLAEIIAKKKYVSNDYLK